MENRYQGMKNAMKALATKRNIFILFGVLIIFFIALVPPTDPDMGWHLQDGKYLLENNFKVADRDIFSYTMPDFPLIMHEWTTDILMAKIYERANLFALSVFFAAIVTSAFLLVSLGVKAKIEYRIASALLGTIASIPVLGVRPQMISLLGLAAVIYIIFRFRAHHDSRIIFWLPLLFLVWVNAHGGFPVGLFFIAVYLALEILKNAIPWGIKKIEIDPRPCPEFSFRTLFFEDCHLVGKRLRNWALLRKAGELMKKSALPPRKILRLGVVLALSAAATLLNPYGWKVYIEIVTTIFDHYAKANINEWMPVTIANPMSYQFVIYLSLLFILLAISFQKTDYTYLAVVLVFLFLGISSWRHMPVFLIVSTPLWVSITKGIAGEELPNAVTKKWFLAFLLAGLCLAASQRLMKDVPFSYDVEKIAERGGYPLKAVNYLKENPIEGRMFNEYNWGGFLIWQFPEKKVFIDGRMPSWRIGGQRIFEEFNIVTLFQEGWQDILKKYDVNFALVFNNPPNRVFYLNSGWKQNYCDEMACVFVRSEEQK